LMDEPFVSLNEELRETMRELIKLSDVTTLLVTHEFEESSALYDRVIEMEKL